MSAGWLLALLAASGAGAAESVCMRSVAAAAPACDAGQLNPAIATCAPGSRPTDQEPEACVKNQADDGSPGGSAPEYASYDEARTGWKASGNAPEALNAWIGANFSYDRSRAKSPDIRVYEPVELFEKKSGICVDLSRFAYETLKGRDTVPGIAPESDPKYLKIAFEPCKLGPKILSLHWLVRVKTGEDFYFLADSKHQGRTYGPCASTQEFVEAYQRLRCRKVLCYNERDTYRREAASRTLKTR